MPEPLRITKMIYGGDGVASTGERLPFVLSGEIVQSSASHQFSVLEPSPDRGAPGCIHFGSCGGCHYQQAAYPAQLRIKQGILENALHAAELADRPAITIHSAEPWHYRNRIRLRVGEVEGELNGELDGELCLGYNRHGAEGGGPLLPVTMCPIAAPVLWRAASTLLDLAKTQVNPRSWLASAVELELFTNHDETAVQLTLYTRNPPPAGFTDLCSAAQRVLPQLIGAGVGLLPKNPSPQGRRSEHAKPGLQWGAPGLVYKVGNDSHWVSRGAFFQVNRHLVSTLVELATSGRSGSLAWDLYAGVGLFSRALAQTFVEVIAVEAAQPAATDLAALLKSSGRLQPHRALAMTTLDFLQVAVVQRERPGLIVMDPPRAGLGAEVCALLARVSATELVYVSCDPLTLARDLRNLTASGYSITELHLVDMFPQTFHMETVAVLRR